ncbi:MAG: hypothetical protein KDD67_05335 [Ignavibacteriae bacterium]|nr:hypothetical protein [Ignavibacteriota bacterium]MCB9216252.1 hypothetical protein [Ignavibacteria bacterium]
MANEQTNETENPNGILVSDWVKIITGKTKRFVVEIGGWYHSGELLCAMCISEDMNGMTSTDYIPLAMLVKITPPKQE